jgi:GMP synthase-like glutamine amidotransferase
MLIGILQTGLAPDALAPQFGEYPAMFKRLLGGYGLGFRTYAVVDGAMPGSASECDGWLITGSRHGAYEDHAWIPPLEQLIRDAIATHVPVVGICFGHQIVAQAMGGRVEKYAGGWSVGATDYDFDGESITLNAWHQDQVIQVPKGAKVIASNDFCANAALAYDNDALTIQAHPEYGSDFINGLMQTRGKGVVPDALMAAATARLETPLQHGVIADRIAAFFKAPRPISPRPAPVPAQP